MNRPGVITVRDEHMTRWTGPDRKKPGPDRIYILMGRFLGFVFTTNRVSGLDRTVPGIRDLTRTGPKKNFSLKYIDKDIELLVNVIYNIMYKT